MIRPVTTLALLPLLAAPAHAQQQRIYGPDGRSLGTVMRDSAGNARVRDERGGSLGTSSTTSSSVTTYYDERGRVIGRSR